MRRRRAWSRVWVGGCRRRLRPVRRRRRAYSGGRGVLSGGFRFGGFGGGRRGVLDAGTDKAYEGAADGFAGFVDLAHRQLALVELAVLELCPDGAGDDILDALWGWLLQGLHGGLDGVGEHQDAGLLALRARSGVAEVRLADIYAGQVAAQGLFECLAVEVLDAGCTVVFPDQVEDLSGQVPLPPNLQPDLDVAFDDAGREGGGQGRVGVHAGDLVLYKVLRVLELADVVVV